MALAEHYFRTQVAGQAEGTVDAKQRDLACFLTFYVPDIPQCLILFGEYLAIQSFIRFSQELEQMLVLLG
jgi:hypothetical protein